MVRINWTLLAVEDLQEVKDYISRDSKQYAKIQIKRLKLRTNSLKLNPQIGRIVPEIQVENIRELLDGNYRIIYKIIAEDRIDILTVHHCSRDLLTRNIHTR